MTRESGSTYQVMFFKLVKACGHQTIYREGIHIVSMWQPDSNYLFYKN